MPALATGIGSMPGEDFHESLRVVLGELHDLPHVPELPSRGPIAGMVGRSLAMISELGFDLQPAGWRLTDAPGVDARRAKSLLAEDLDAVEEQTQGYAGRFKVQVAGPWTLAASVERPRGDRLLADRGARREVAEALALGLAEHIADVRRRIPGASLIVQVDEPSLPAVMAGKVPTASGFHRHRSVDAPMASAALSPLFDAIASAGAVSVAHCCAAAPPVGLLRGAGASAVSLEAVNLAAETFDEIAIALDAGEQVYLGVAATDRVESTNAIAQRIRRLLGMIGYDAEAIAGQIVVTPTCGLAGTDPAMARTILTAVAKVAAGLNAG